MVDDDDLATLTRVQRWSIRQRRISLPPEARLAFGGWLKRDGCQPCTMRKLRYRADRIRLILFLRQEIRRKADFLFKQEKIDSYLYSHTSM